MRTLLPTLAAAFLALTACGEEPTAKSPASAASSAPATDAKPATAKSPDVKDAPASSGAGGPSKPEVTCRGKIDIGKPTASFALSAVNGGNKIAVDKGKVTIVDFWATWCEPCKKSFPKYQELYVKYKASGLEIIGVSVDDEKRDIPDFIKSYGAKFPVGWDEGHKIADCFKPSNMPSAYVIDKNGVVRFVHTGFRPGEERELEKEIKSLL
jgi:thiol-disulfide isomerase/thioredoxin